jgi:nitroimidazol reductase NimA-like FMN-containing flavoprotein (pyridoxamine 5'-phosphate oxidase superfamily)
VSSQERIPLVYQRSQDWIFLLDQLPAIFSGMRKEIFRMERAEAVALLERSGVVHLASTTADGAPVLRTVHGVVVRGALAFHGAPAGEKMEVIGREAVVSAEEVVAAIPSYFIDPERACPATTLYRSAQVHGRVERVDDAEEKAEVLSALMHRFQPEGGHVPITAGDPLYKKAVAGILVLKVSLEQLDGKAKLAQNRTPVERQRLMEKLWARGLPGDPAAIELMRAANPGTPMPAFLTGPAGVSLVAALEPADATAAAELLVDAYWNGGVLSRRDRRGAPRLPGLGRRQGRAGRADRHRQGHQRRGQARLDLRRDDRSALARPRPGRGADAPAPRPSGAAPHPARVPRDPRRPELL